MAVFGARADNVRSLCDFSNLPELSYLLYQMGWAWARWPPMRIMLAWPISRKLLTRDRAFNTSLWNNLKWLIFYLAAIPAGLFIALFLNQTVRGIRLYKSLFFFPFVISQIVVGLVFTWFYDPQYGLFNGIIGFIGFEPINVLGDPTLSTYGHYRRWDMATNSLLYDPLSHRIKLRGS